MSRSSKTGMEIRYNGSIFRFFIQFKIMKDLNLLTNFQNLMSSSVADALQFLMDSGHPDCSDAAGTIDFIRVIDRLFDIFNIKSLYGKGFKTPLFNMWNSVIQKSIRYLSSLTDVNNVPMLHHRRKNICSWNDY